MSLTTRNRADRLPRMSVSEFPLGRGERLLWSGAPRQGIVFRPSDGLHVPFSVIWGSFAVFWNVGVWKSNAPFFFRLWGVPFLIAAAYITVGRFFIDARIRARTLYGVTTDRVLIASGLWMPTLTSLDLRTLSGLTLTQHRDGLGTIV